MNLAPLFKLNLQDSIVESNIVLVDSSIDSNVDQVLRHFLMRI